MSYNYNYNPVPPRVWSRVQNPCTYTDASGNSNINYQQVFIPLTGQVVPQGQANYEAQQFYKGNILQYKANSARFTKAQKYSQLAKMCGPNRTKVFATQSETYTNPNTTGLLRVNYNTYPYPNEIVGAPNNISGPFVYNIQNPNDCSGNSIQDGGTLVCGTYANPCTGEIIQQAPTTSTICNSASASNVPGSSTLCWNNKIQTFFPKSRYVMNNSTSKWPEGYKGFVSALTPDAPVLDISYNEQCNIFYITLSWTVNNSVCIPISSFRIYQNGKLIQTVSNQITSYNLTTSNKNNSNNFYVTSVSTNIESSPSNTVTPFKPLLFTASGNYTVYNNNCFTGIVFDYQSGSQSLTLYYPQLVTLIVIGGGGGGTSGGYYFLIEDNFNPCGGGGGGITYIQNLYLEPGSYIINVGSGGSGSSDYGSGGYGGSGGNSNFGLYTSYGGGGGGDYGGLGGGVTTLYGGGGGMGTCSNSNFAAPTSINNIISGTNSNAGNQGSIITTSFSQGGNSFYANNSIPIFVPFINLNSTITVGGGGGGGGVYGGGGGGGVYGGGAGQGIGGISSASSTINGENGNNSITSGYGGGGGGGGGNPTVIYGNGGNGGNGAVIVYWPPYSTSYINTNNFIGNYVIYNNNGYIGYVFNYGVGSISFNQNINNVNMVLCGGGGAGSDAYENIFTNGGGGGGGGGTTYYQNLSFNAGQSFSISVGGGGTYINPNGSDTIFGTNPNYTATGGGGSYSSNCNGGGGGYGYGIGGGGGGGGGGYYFPSGDSTGGSGGGGSYSGSIGETSGFGSSGGNSYIYNDSSGITMPFLPAPTTIQFGGGGQSALKNGSTDSGGNSGLGVGGIGGGTNQIFFGGNGINNINQGFGGGGGGSGGNGPTIGGTGGSGGNGVIILWWPTT